ncbi:MAG TPA: CpaF family protein [Anaerolinea thermolimosa]|uniref:CpaF family protein n=1 Tax=Anaerolinea thermolimosa TaxID=229919 RepID=A0A3D1JCP7_9CHLR|nr:CpaF family protein [Anaerolinea thermolimosa]GAP05703.1 Flp pilus assembly protein, ATPase CpaF [Anaerolinea thermolimosa]HCE16349.1 CpaF family protein [Anaerolinea thermolimosa]
MNNPALSARQADLNKLKDYLISTISRELEANPPPIEERRKVIYQHLQDAYQNTRLQLPTTIRDQIFRDILDDLLGFGPLQPLLEDPDISEIMVNGPKFVYIERRGKIQKTNITFEDDEAVLRLIEKIVLPLGRRIDADTPTVDARLPDGSRVNAIIPPCAIDGPTITIRKFQKDKLTIQQLINLGSITQNMADFIRACVISRLNIIISGGTGSGKTTLLNILSSFIPADERIITIEDAAELKLQQEHVVRLETKPPNAEGRNAVTVRDLVRNALRMRPDRIVVGECRGGEALDMLQAMNTGHDGSLTTLHANTPRDALSRLETMVLMSGMDLPVRVIREQIASAIDLIIQQARMRDGTRKVISISEVSGMEGDTIVMTEIFKFEQTGISSEGKVLGELKPTGIRPLFTPRLEAAGFKLGPEVFGANLSGMISGSRGNRR